MSKVIEFLRWPEAGKLIVLLIALCIVTACSDDDGEANGEVEASDPVANADGGDEITQGCIEASQRAEPCDSADDCPDIVCNCQNFDVTAGHGCGTFEGGTDSATCVDPEEICPEFCTTHGGWTGDCEKVD